MKMLKKVCLLFIIIFVFTCTGYAEFQNNGNGTVTDTETGLMWQQSTAATQMAWEDALQYCEDLPLADHNDWRLPTIRELASIVDYGEYNPAINKDYFPDTVSSPYWSGTTRALFPDLGWLLHFDAGDDASNLKSFECYVRAVRSVQ